MPAIRLSSVVFPEPLRPRKTVQLPGANARCATSRPARPRPPPSGNAFLTPCRTTADCALIAITEPPGARPAPAGLQDREGVDRHSDAALQQQRTEGEEKLVGPILGKIVEVEDFHDVGAAVPDEVDVHPQTDEPEPLSLVFSLHTTPPLDAH